MVIVNKRSTSNGHKNAWENRLMGQGACGAMVVLGNEHMEPRAHAYIQFCSFDMKR